MRYICTNKCDISPFGNCVITGNEKDGFRCSKGQIPGWTEFDSMGGQFTKSLEGLKKEDLKAKQHENFLWFVENYEQLYLIHGKCYLVIVDKAVVHSAKTAGDALKWVQDNHIPYYNIQYNDGTLEGYTVRLVSVF